MAMETVTLRCPKCGHGEMDKLERSGVVIDRCGNCGGIFLDRGELQALLRAETDFNDRLVFEPHTEEEEDPGQKRVTRRGFLEELFDFG